MGSVRERGRPRSFDKGLALQKALEIFSSKGYEGASLDELTQAMGINKPSLYAAFGNKEELFLQALEAYVCPQDQHMRQILFGQTDTRAAFRQLLQSVAEQHAAQMACGQNKGCLLANSTILSCEDQSTVSDKLKSIHEAYEALMQERLELGLEQGDLAAGTNPQALARYFNSVIIGMSVLARAQQCPEALHQIAQVASKVLE